MLLLDDGRLLSGAGRHRLVAPANALLNLRPRRANFRFLVPCTASTRSFIFSLMLFTAYLPIAIWTNIFGRREASPFPLFVQALHVPDVKTNRGLSLVIWHHPHISRFARSRRAHSSAHWGRLQGHRGIIWIAIRKSESALGGELHPGSANLLVIKLSQSIIEYATFCAIVSQSAGLSGASTLRLVIIQLLNSKNVLEAIRFRISAVHSASNAAGSVRGETDATERKTMVLVLVRSQCGGTAI